MKHVFKSFLCGLVALSAMQASAGTFIGGRTDFRDETIYFCMTSRFYDGDPSNNTYCWDGVKNVNDPEWRGDFKGLIQKLDYLKALGFTAVWITPVVENASGLDYHGYHAINFSKVDPRNESTDCKFQDLIDAAHARGMKIVLDIVLQHTGNFGEENLCPMFEKDYTANQSNIDKVMKLHPNSKLPANYFSMQPAAQYHARLSQMKNVDGQNHDTHNYWHHYAHFNWDDASRWWGQIAGDCVDLNTENPAVTNYLVDCYSNFIAMGVDAFRIDTSGHISRLTFNKAFIPQFHAAGEQYKAKRGGTPFYMFGEVCARAEEVIYRNGDYNTSPCWYTWKETKDYAWDYSETSWDNYVVKEGEKGGHVNALSVIQQETDYAGQGNMAKSNNAWLNGNDYHTPDYSQSSGFNVIDFPMHWRFHRADNAFGVHSQDNLYNDATWNVVYVDSHDYGPNGYNTISFSGGTAAWAENLSLMFTFRGIPCIYHGTETEFRKGSIIDEGPNKALFETSRAYYGGYMKGSVNVTDFAEYNNATGNLKASLSHPLARHIQRLNKIRAAVPALRKGQYSVQGCSGKMAFKRRYTDSSIDSYCLVTISGGATFSGIENGTYVDCVTGDTKTVTNGSLTVSCSGQGNLRVYVLNTSKTPAPGKIGEDGKYLYGSSPVSQQQFGYDGTEEEKDFTTVRDNESVNPGGGGDITEPDEPIAPSMSEGEQAVFFENTSNWGGTIKCYTWAGGVEFGGAWSGSAMTYLGNKIWKWTYTGSSVIPATAGVIFNNGGSQTDDFTWVNGGYYNASGYVKTIEGAGEIKPDDPPVNPPTPTDDFKIYYDNSGSKWATPHIHYWGGSSQSQWPGVAMSKVEGNVWVYTVAAGTTGCLFNAGDGDASKTSDFTAVADHIYNQAGDQGEYKGTTTTPDDPVIDPPTPSGDYTVYFDNSVSNWSSVYTWIWDNSRNYTGGNWPGAAMTLDSATGYYKYTFTPAENATGLMCIFSQNGTPQTADLEFHNLGIYTSNGFTGNYVEVLKPVIPGDANGDSMIDSTDIAYIIDYILGINHDNFNADASDLNGDGEIDATDIGYIIKMILK